MDAHRETVRDLEDTLFAISRYLGSTGYLSEVLDISVDFLGTAPQSRSRRKRLALLEAYRLFVIEHFGVETVRYFDR